MQRSGADGIPCVYVRALLQQCLDTIEIARLGGVLQVGVPIGYSDTECEEREVNELHLPLVYRMDE